LAVNEAERESIRSFVEGFKDIGKPAPPPEEWNFDWLREPAPRPEWEFNKERCCRKRSVN
jgi:hypothetical protein